MKKIAVLPGDGIGPEVIGQARKALETVADKHDIELKFSCHAIGACSIDKYGVPITEETIKACLNADAVLLGAIGDPKYDNDPSAKIRPEQGLLTLRKELGLYANIRPVRCSDFMVDKTPLKPEMLKGVDLVIYRELIGGIYFGKKEKSDDFASDLCKYHDFEIDRIAKQAFITAQQRRKKLTLVDKANVLETSRLWRSRIQEMSKDFPDVQVDYLYVDNAAMQLIINPAQFDVILTENMFGDILSDEASVLAGSLGLLPSASIGTATSLFEPSHGSYPQVANLDKANPAATILSAAMLLDHLGYPDAGTDIREAVDWCIQHQFTTEDINDTNPVSCGMMGDMVAVRISEEEHVQPNKVNRETFYI